MKRHKKWKRFDPRSVLAASWDLGAIISSPLRLRGASNGFQLPVWMLYLRNYFTKMESSRSMLIMMGFWIEMSEWINEKSKCTRPVWALEWCSGVSAQVPRELSSQCGEINYFQVLPKLRRCLRIASQNSSPKMSLLVPLRSNWGRIYIRTINLQICLFSPPPPRLFLYSALQKDLFIIHEKQCKVFFR